ncbi:hypothetical protein CHS0354_022312 [Potamilus streckersoni]|uniref:Fucosyltransferase n=1 Tax=Potamilus streckersoni TaxID=2493646 RepID=A0AAE0THU0_9BIVA|nr:hypothetical protein CHS0354_022312 [Potamilus streckersoni]
MKLQMMNSVPWKKFKRSLLSCLIALLIFYIVYRVASYSPGLQGDSSYINKFQKRQFSAKSTKRILMWTPFFHVSADDMARQQSDCLEKCDKKCEIHANKSDMDSSDAVLFHLTDLWLDKWKFGTKNLYPFPVTRSPEQVWILMNMEPTTFLFGDIKVLNNVFNWTFWYRRDATVYLSYGGYSDRSYKERMFANWTLKPSNFYQEKSKSAAIGLISDCTDSAQRYRFVETLKKYMQVDMFGACYGRQCGSNINDPHSCDENVKQYRFYLALENSKCRDYVTEKYWYTLQRHQIPIVNWKQVSNHVVVPNSYINIHDFETPEAAAQYVTKVRDNETLYNSYFDWMSQYSLQEVCSMCRLCRALHDNKMQAQVYSDLKGWVEDDVCPTAGYISTFKRNFLFWTYHLLGL